MLKNLLSDSILSVENCRLLNISYAIYDTGPDMHESKPTDGGNVAWILPYRRSKRVDGPKDLNTAK